MTAEISVALCTYNGARLRRRAAGAASSTRAVSPTSSSISDDGSSDGTLEIVAATVEAAAARGAAPDVVVLAGTTPSGVTAELREGDSARTTRPLIALSDQDDIWHPGRLAALAARFDDDALTFLHTDARLVGRRRMHLSGRRSSNRSSSPTRSFGSKRADARSTPCYAATSRPARPWSSAASSSPAALPFPPEWVHDEWLAVIAAATGRVGVVRESDDRLPPARQEPDRRHRTDPPLQGGPRAGAPGGPQHEARETVPGARRPARGARGCGSEGLRGRGQAEGRLRSEACRHGRRTVFGGSAPSSRSPDGDSTGGSPAADARTSSATSCNRLRFVPGQGAAPAHAL